jgi:hypothetical protein
MIPIFPERTLPILPVVELLSCPPGDQLHRTCDFSFSLVDEKQVHMIRRYDIVQQRQAIATVRNIEPMPPPPSVALELQQKLPLMAAMGDMPNLSFTEDSICPRHGSSN